MLKSGISTKNSTLVRIIYFAKFMFNEIAVNGVVVPFLEVLDCFERIYISWIVKE